MQRLPPKLVAPLWAATILFTIPFNGARSQEALAVRCLGFTPQMMTNSVRTIDALFNTVRQATQFKARTLVVAYDPIWSFPQWIAVDDTTEFAMEPAPLIWHRVSEFSPE